MIASNLFAQSSDVVGKVAVSSGNVTALNNGQKRQLKISDSIMNNDTILTEDRSSVKLLFSDETVIDLGPKSSFKVSDYALKSGDNRTETFSLLFGKMRSLVTKKVGPQGKVQYKTGSTVMGVRGTEFVVDNPQGSLTPNASIVVVSGIVAVAGINGGTETALKSGEKMSGNFNNFSQPSIQKVSTEQMTSITTSAKTEDKTFESAVTIQPQNQAENQAEKPMVLGMLDKVLAKEVNADMNGTNRVEVKRAPPEFLDHNNNLLPPVNSTAGNNVTVSVTVQ